MEEVLEFVIKECHYLKNKDIANKCNIAKDLLESQSNLMSSLPCELRSACFDVFQECLMSKNVKLMHLAINGYQKLLRDNQFYNGIEEPDESTWLPHQLLISIQCLPEYPDDIQVELLKILINMSCIQDITLSGHTVVDILSFCGLANRRGTIAMQSASQSASIQAITSLLQQIKFSLNENKIASNSDQLGTYDYRYPTYDEVVPVINFIADKLSEANKHRESKSEIKIPALFLLECANCIVQGLCKSSKQSKSIEYPPEENTANQYCSTLLISSLWQRLCPAIIAVLGTPISTKVYRGSGRTQGQMGRGSGTSSLPHQLFSSQEARVIYSVSCNLIVAMGTVGEMRPVLESLLHRMLLYPPPVHRQDSLRAVAELLRSPTKLVQLAGPILYPDPRNLQRCDLSLFQLVIDSLMECSNCSDASMKIIIMDCISALLTSLETISEGQCLTAQQIKLINGSYAQLEDGDYKGPLTYDSQIQFPKFHYEECVSEDDITSISSNDSDTEVHIGEMKCGDSFISNLQDFFEEEDDSDDHCDENDTDDECPSFSSGDTEGPDEKHRRKTLMLAQRQLLEDEEEDMRLLRLSENVRSEVNSRNLLVTDEEEQECINARHFCETLVAILPSLLAIRSTIEVDEAVLEFSSKYCQGVYNDCPGNGKEPSVIINADGIYLATYAALSLNLQLITGGYYYRNDSTVPASEEEFVDNVFASGVLIYLTSSWVTELYCQVLNDSFLQRAGYNASTPDNCALINILTDINGLGSTEEGSQMLSDFRRLSKAGHQIHKNETSMAGKKLCRRILTCCWESVVSVLGNLLKFLEGENGILAPIRLLLLADNVRKDEAKRGQDMLVLCLNSLQSIAKLANVLGLQKRCGVIFSLLSSACLPKDGILSSYKKKTFRALSLSKKQPLKLHRAHILSFHVMMSSGLELGSHTSECWSHIIKCCLYIAKLERKFHHDLDTCSPYGSNFNSSNQVKKRRNSDSSEELYREDCIRISTPTSPHCNSSVNIEELMKQFEGEISSAGFLSTHLSRQVLCNLTVLVDKFFDNASTQLNLSSLLSFLVALCEASESQLFTRSNSRIPKKSLFRWTRNKHPDENLAAFTAETLVDDLLLFHRLSEAMLKIVKSGRPLIHIMKVWAILGPHFLKAACHKDNAVSKEAVSSIHDVINCFLGNHIEFAHFHFNEALFKPFENLLCLELCDIEVQDQIVNSICEFVESCNLDIKSGWRPLFGALRCIKAPSIRSSQNVPGHFHESVDHLRAVREVFEAFLNTDNALVFSNAALDCILCLLNHIKIQGEDEEVAAETVLGWNELVGGDFCLDALRYLQRCAVILSSMYLMPSIPVFHAVHRVTFDMKPHLVDPQLPFLDESQLDKYYKSINSDLTELDAEILQELTKLKVINLLDYSCLWPDTNSVEDTIFTNNNSDLLRVWYILIEGLSGSVITCNRKYQSQVLETLFALMKALPVCPGQNFGLYCMNHQLLPLMQEWLRKLNSSSSAISDRSSTFKQYVGFASDLIVEYIEKAVEDDNFGNLASCKLMFQQCLLVLVECVGSSSESIARLGCSCIRHIAESSGSRLPSNFWDILILSIHRASQIALYPVYQLMTLFSPDSPNFYGDLGQVKVAARRDCTQRDNDRLRLLAQQVFLLDLIDENPVPDLSEVEDRSFIFLLYSNKEDENSNPTRVSFRELVVGLIVNQMILQMLGILLLKDSLHVIPSLANALLQPSNFAGEFEKGKTSIQKEIKLPGMLRWLNKKQITTLLRCLNLSFNAAVQFDARPGLKFLIQKVAQSDRALNLYKQTGACWTLKMLTLYEIILSKIKTELDRTQFKRMIENVTAVESKPDPVGSLNASDVAYEETEMYVRLLLQTFTELSNAYIELVTKDNTRNHTNSVEDKYPTLSLPSLGEELPETERKKLIAWLKVMSDDVGITESSDSIPPSSSEEELPASTSILLTTTLGASKISEEVLATNPFEEESNHPDEDNQINESNEQDSGLHSSSDTGSSVFSTTETDISRMIGDYRWRKSYHSMPSQYLDRRSNPFNESFRPPQNVPPEIEEQRTKSIMKDKESCLNVWTEMVVSVFDLFVQLKDDTLEPTLPLVIPSVRSIMIHADNPQLQAVIAKLINRVAHLYKVNIDEY